MSEPSESPLARPNHHRRQRHGGDLTVPQSSRPGSSLSFTSLIGQQQRPHSSLSVNHPKSGQQHGIDADEGGGAEIPDIPLKRPGRRLTSEQQALKPSRIDEAWGEEDNNDWTPHRPINPNSITSQKDRLPSSISPPMSPITHSSRSRANSETSTYRTDATSMLPALQTKGAGDDEILEPLAEEEVEPGSFDLVVPSHGDSGQHYDLEDRSLLIFSKDHLRAIFRDHILLQRFTDFLHSVRPDSLPLLSYYLDCLKALRAISYANAITDGLDTLPEHDFSTDNTYKTVNTSLEKKAEAAFDVLVQQDLPAYVTHLWIQTVTTSISKRITGTLPVQLKEMSEGLAEVFCLTDPSRHDNPIIFASEEFHRTTQYGMKHVIGRNCRFLQGPKTDPFSVRRIRDKISAGKEHFETFLNYRRDGSPFMNLLMIAPLYDSRGAIRYFIGAQVDVSGLAKQISGLDALQNLVAARESAAAAGDEIDEDLEDKDEFQNLCDMFNMTELETVRRRGGNMHRVPQDEPQDGSSNNWHKPRILLQDETSSIEKHGLSISPSISDSGKLPGIYEYYLLVRPYPSLRVLFASPSLRMPGILQSNFMDKIGGSNRVRDGLHHAFAGGHGVTAKVRWMSSANSEGRVRWIHCTPLLGSNGAVGVWMIVLIDDESDPTAKKGKEAPPVDGRLRKTAAALERERPYKDKDDSLSLAGYIATASSRGDEVDSHDEFDISIVRPGSRSSRHSSRLSREPGTPRRHKPPAFDYDDELSRSRTTVRLED
ncbi:hypothetical protein J7T55_001050 [Diaporthe amygdali]|uniref:uncharacterized protein n=1 Tax=Phomopsis amygdali TaxID=1214568 RepID=UPI0022FE8CB8|nr:uncharacterized protein J7T55_001050 [Diaporthe amygdali]KAJ0120194.1 hypothetical protein J7T55_001050 [Diaporthe amygdali]